MAITVGTTAQADYNTSSVTITKPTSLAEGDLLIAVLTGANDAALETASGWTALQTETTNGATASLQYKIADSGDVAASNFTFTNSSSDGMAGALLRVTGYAPTSLFSDSAKDTVANTDVGNFAFDSDTVSPRTNGELIIVLAAANQATAVGSAGSPTINGTNPSWTNFLDQNLDQGGGTDFAIARAWHGIQAADADITSMTAALTDDAQTDQAIIVAALSPQTSVTGTFAHLSVSPTIVAPVASVGTTGTFTHLGISPTLNAPVANGTQPTQWVDRTKNDPNWTNRTK